MVIDPDYLLRRNMKWTGSANAVFCLLVLIQLSCHQWMVNATWPHPRCNDQNFAITADNKLEMYVDGERVTSLTHPNSPSIADTVPLSGSAKLIAITGKNSGEHGGFLGSAGNFVTDGSWKCTDEFHDRWQEVDFDDSTWPVALVVGLNGYPPWHHVEGISLFASWIWVSTDYSGPDKKKDVYCRKKLECGYQTTTRRRRTTRAPPTPAPPTPAPPTHAPPTPAPPTHAPPTHAPPTPAPPTPAPPTSAPPSCNGGSGETGPSCITSCSGRANGDYQSCKGCKVYASCSNGILYDNRPCPAGLYWDDNVKRCEWESTTCKSCEETRCSGTGAACIISCLGKADGVYQSCMGCQVFAICSNGRLDDNLHCPAGLHWDDNVKRCERESKTCQKC